MQTFIKRMKRFIFLSFIDFSRVKLRYYLSF